MLDERNLASVRADNRQVVQEAVDWITRQHGDALAKWVEGVWFAGLSEGERKGLATADPAIKSIHDTNLLEYLIAEGVFAQDEGDVPVLRLILDAALSLEDGQRGYLKQLAENPLRLYRVSRCSPGEGFNLETHPDAGGDSIYIEDKWASRMIDKDDIVGLRLMQTCGVWETSGAVYHFPVEYVTGLLGSLESTDANDYSRTLFNFWLGLVAAHV